MKNFYVIKIYNFSVSQIEIKTVLTFLNGHTEIFLVFKTVCIIIDFITDYFLFPTLTSAKYRALKKPNDPLPLTSAIFTKYITVLKYTKENIVLSLPVWSANGLLAFPIPSSNEIYKLYMFFKSSFKIFCFNMTLEN